MAEHRKLATILFTDIVGSTELKSRLGELKAVSLIREHHALLRQILGRFDEGQEVETAGDSFLLLFAKPSDAVKFALLAQSAVRARNFKESAQSGIASGFTLEKF